MMAIKNSDFKNQNVKRGKINKEAITNKFLGSSTSGIVFIDNITESDVKDCK